MTRVFVVFALLLCWNVRNIAQGLDSELLIASMNGQLSEVESLLSQGANIDYQNATGLSALLLAVDKGHSEVATALLSKDANPDLKDYFGTTALMYSVRNDDLVLAKLLIKHKADVGAKDNFGDSALIYAIRLGNKDMISLIAMKASNLDEAIQNAKDWGNNEILVLLESIASGK